MFVTLLEGKYFLFTKRFHNVKVLTETIACIHKKGSPGQESEDEYHAYGYQVWCRAGAQKCDAWEELTHTTSSRGSHMTRMEQD